MRRVDDLVRGSLFRRVTRSHHLVAGIARCPRPDRTLVARIDAAGITTLEAEATFGAGTYGSSLPSLVAFRASACLTSRTRLGLAS